MKRFFLLVPALFGIFGIQSCQLPTATKTTTTNSVAYSVVYKVNGALGSAPTDTAMYAAGASVTVLGYGALSKTGYSFSGWNTLSDGSGTGYAEGARFVIGTASVTLYAQWVANTNTITFHPNGGSGTMSPQTVATNATAPLAACAFTYEGYSFLGWSTRADAVGAMYTDSASFTMGTAGLTLYAVWRVNTYTITFNPNGGSGSMAGQTLTTGASGRLATNTFTRAGYAFSGWNTLADGSGTSYAAGAQYTMGTANVTLNAQWTNSTTVPFPITTPTDRVVTISGNSTIPVGFPAVFTSTYFGNAVAYQWYLNGSEIPGATLATLTYTQAEATASYGINVLMLKVTDENGIAYAGTFAVGVHN